MLKELIRYTEIADRKVIRVFEMAGKPMPEAERLFSHVLNSQHIWVSRIMEKKTIFERFDNHAVADFSDLHRQNITALFRLEESEDLFKKVTYANSSGEVFTDDLKDILFHVVNHSTYHRAQIAMQFRLNGMNPPVTDYIFLKRQGEL